MIIMAILHGLLFSPMSMQNCYHAMKIGQRAANSVSL